MPALAAISGNSLKGTITVLGDKSISHRALMLSGIAVGRTIIRGLLEGHDVMNTRLAMQHLGVNIERTSDGNWQVDGVGIGGLIEPKTFLDMGNSGTSTRLLIGMVTSYPFTSFFSGDISLNSRPMGRITSPLSKMGANFITRKGNHLPMAVIGTGESIPINYTSPVASAQIKSAILFAALNTAGQTTVNERIITRDHSERMLEHFGVSVTRNPYSDSDEQKTTGQSVSIHGHHEISATSIDVPGDFSSAAFLIVAGLIVPGSKVILQNVGMNPLRTGLLITLQEMGANITIADLRICNNEQIADLEISHSNLSGVNVPAARASSMIDEYPILAIAAGFASGETRMEGLSELKVKESNRLQAIADGLIANKVDVEIGVDWLIVQGKSPDKIGGGKVNVHNDHRIAMSFLVMGLAAKHKVTIDDDAMIDTSFPGFSKIITQLGGQFCRS